VKDFIYRNGVYPVQGVRPVFTSIQEIFNSVTTLVHKAMSSKETVISHEVDTLVLREVGGSEVLSSYHLVGDRDRVAHSLTTDPEWVKIVSIHEVGHSLLSFTRYGSTPLFCVLQHEGAITVGKSIPVDTFYSQWANIVMLVAGSVAVQRILGISKVSGHTRDFQEATNAIVTMIREDGYHQVLSVYLAGTGSSHLVPEDSIEKLRFTPAYVSHGASDIKTDVFLRETKFDQELVGMAFFRAQKEAAEMVDANKAAILEAAEILGTDMFLDGNTLQEIFLRHNLVKAEMVVKPRKADNSISGD
jgi:hypothetical protein